MKKISILIAFLLSVAFSYAQFSPVPRGTPTQIDQFRGVIQGLRGAILSVVDTTANPLTPYYGAITVLPSDAGKDTVPIYISNGLHWVKLSGASGINRNDTLFAQLPAYFDSTTRPGSTILKVLQPNGLLSGGVVTLASCMSLDITPPVIVLNYNTYVGIATNLTVPAADPSFPRTDEVIDSLGKVILRTGTPSSTPVPKGYNPSTEVLLTTYTIGAGATCLGILNEVVYDGIADAPGQWGVSTSGTIAANFTSTAFPYHLTQACFISTYATGSSLIFTRTGNDTAQANEILKLFISSNGLFGNQFQISFFNGAAQVGSTVTFNNAYGFNPSDSNNYQNVSIPFSEFNLSNQIFNKIVITFFGNDLSGAKGLYTDYIQLQTGLNNFTNSDGVLYYGLNETADSTLLVTKKGIRFTAPLGGGSGGSETLQQVLTNGSDISGQDNTIVIGTKSLFIRNDVGGINMLLNPDDEFSFGDLNNDYGMGFLDISKDKDGNAITTLDGGDGDMIINTPVVSGNPLFVYGWGADSLTHRYNNYNLAVKTPSVPNDTTLIFTDFNGTATSYTIRGGGTVLNGTGYVKMSGATVSYLTQIPAATDISGTLSVAHGGTGIATTTAYGVIVGGATPTGIFQNAGTGTTGQILTSNGASALPTWTTPAIGTVYTALSPLILTGSVFSADTTKSIGRLATYSDIQNTVSNVTKNPTFDSFYVYKGTSGAYTAFRDSIGLTNVIQVNYWIKAASNKLYYNLNHVGIGTDTAYSPLQIAKNGLGTAVADSTGILITNSTLATSGSALQYPGVIEWSGYGWDATGVAANKQNLRISVRPTSASGGGYPSFFLEGSRDNWATSGTYFSVSEVSGSGPTFTIGNNIISQNLITGNVLTMGGVITTNSFLVNTSSTTYTTATNQSQSGASFSNSETNSGSANLVFNNVKIGGTVNSTTGLTMYRDLLDSVINQNVTGATHFGIVQYFANNQFANGTGLTSSFGLAGYGVVPHSTLTVNGSLAYGYVTTATSLTATISNSTIEVTATGQTVTLPTAVGISGRQYQIKLSSSGTCTVATTSSQTIDGSTTYTLSAQYKFLTVQSNGANWLIFANN